MTIYSTLVSVDITEREQKLADYIVSKFKSLLLIEHDEELPFDQNYFELGLTSLQIEQLKQEFEADFDVAITPTVFFNNPTLQGLVTHLRDHVLNGFFQNVHSVEKQTIPLDAQIQKASDPLSRPLNWDPGSEGVDERDIVNGLLNSLFVRD
ncbi:MAG: acyl carrier protein [Candidatus Thiodiazotropha sp. (ex Ctena orbiculata)]|nr:acyl carrier protein [Candidatus Thiodiazotropha sp. (ex Codakia orbicularis)]MBV2124239.1 acyl carrier protein [Candidatus Thiodiazotropha taylori]